MALHFEIQDSVRKRKRKRTKTMLSLNERVEVRSEEEGFLGSWHPGTITACEKQDWQVKYDVKYDHILVDDGSDHLVDHVWVSLLVDDIGCPNANQSRPWIRRFPPQVQFGKYALPYGMCVDAYYEDCWWEGVVFDHEDGLQKRKIFFPDLGDEMVTDIATLRITQDWNGVTETWQHRGIWIFLELLEKYEQEHCLPASVKQLWYDLREKEAFQKLSEWTSCAKGLWEELVLEVISDNFILVVDHLFQEVGLPEGTQKLLEFVKPVKEVNMHPKSDLTETGDLPPNLSETDVLFSAEKTLDGDLLLHPKSSNIQSTEEKSNLEQQMSHSLINGPHMNMLTETNLSCSNEAGCMQPLGFSVLPSHQDGISIISSAINSTCFSTRTGNKMNKNSSYSLSVATGWLPAGPDLVPGAEYCPHAVTKYAQIGNKRHQDPVTIDVQKHLLHLNWKIEFMTDNRIIRLRYTSPNGKCYYSLLQVCLDLCETDAEILSSISQDKQSSLHTSGDSLSPLIGQPPKNHNPESCPQPAISSDLYELTIEPDYCSQAIVDWYNCGLQKRFKKKINKDVDDMILRAKKHLSALGWRFEWHLKGNGSRVLWYRSPMGRRYLSLRQACKSILDDGAFSGYSLSSKEGGSVTVNGRLASEKNISLFSRLEFQSSAESSSMLNVQEVKNAQRNGKDGSYLVSGLHQTEATSDSRNISLSKLRQGTSRRLIKSQNDQKSTPLTCVRSSKRVQQVVVPSPLDHHPRTVLSWLIDNNAVLPRTKVHYQSKDDRHPIAKGRITRDGIKCNCCGKVYTLRGFEVHAGSKYNSPAANIILEDGRSLLDCQMHVNHKKRNFMDQQPNRMNNSWCQGDNDSICSVCHYGGELILCDQCPSSFHKSCLGMKDVPDGDWFCPSCRCRICGQNKLRKDADHLVDDDLLNCTQCNHRYHIGCLRNVDADMLGYYHEGNWFCSKKCEAVFLGLHKLLGTQIPVEDKSLTWTLLKPMQSDRTKSDACDIESMTERCSKLNIALDVMHECFQPIKEPSTGRDVVVDVIFCEKSELNRLNFQGFYTVLLEKDDELITVAAMRVHGEVAEVPLVGTRLQYRRLGMCHKLMSVLEKNLMELEVQRMVLPAVPSALNTWTGSFGFSKMTDSEKLQFADCTFLSFPDAVMCHKLLNKISSSKSCPSTGNSCNVGKSSINKVNQPNCPECQPCANEICLVEHSTSKKESNDNGNGSTTHGNEGSNCFYGDLKCYKRRKTY